MTIPDIALERAAARYDIERTRGAPRAEAMAEAAEVLRDYLRVEEKRKRKVAERKAELDAAPAEVVSAIRDAARSVNMSIETFAGCRWPAIVRVKHDLMWDLFEMLGRNQSAVARVLGMDHTTVRAALLKFARTDVGRRAA